MDCSRADRNGRDSCSLRSLALRVGTVEGPFAGNACRVVTEARARGVAEAQWVHDKFNHAPEWFGGR